VNYIKKLMFVFGPISSLFDFITFGALLLLFPGRQDIFHTGWFLESICTQTLVLDFGRRLALGATRTVLDDPAVRQAYLGA
jgi:ABC-type uncharacterized transport system ATPase subunit